MDSLVISVYEFFINIYNSQAITLIKFLLAIYLVVLIIDIILLAIARGLGANARFLFYGAHIPAELASQKKKTREKWNALRKMAESDKENDWKVMIIKADDMLFNLISKLGYGGENMGEVLEKVESGHFEGIEKVKEAHEMRNRIIHEEELKLELETAIEIMDKYETFLDFFDV